MIFFILFFLGMQTLQANNFLFNENNSLHNLENALFLSDDIAKNLYKMINKDYEKVEKPSAMNPLFTAFPNLYKSLPYASLGSFPTPVQKLKNLAKIYKHKNLYIKRDDLCGKNGKRLYGGNKVRKLEFLLAEALACGSKSVLTWGGVGSNHAVATACYAQELGLKSISLVKPQPNSRYVRKNLKLLQHFGSEIKPCPNNTMREVQTVATMVEKKYQDDVFPYFIPTGGSVPLGIVGFVNAAFELKEQIKKGELPEPDKIYVPAGSWGSAVGLLIGMKLADLKTKLVLVAIEPEGCENDHKKYVYKLFEKTVEYLKNLDGTLPQIILSDNDFFIGHEFAGPQYGLFTKEGCAAQELLKKQEHINLEGTYSAKAMAAMLDYLAKNENKNEVILFWLTYCADTFEQELKKQDSSHLPPFLQAFFEKPVQELDQ